MTKTKIKVSSPHLRTWTALNDALRDAGEAACTRLLELEKAGRRRKQFILRIHSRLNHVRRDRERRELTR